MFSHFFIDRPIFSVVVALIISIAGLVAMQVLPVAQFPQITPVQIQVTANYPGANATLVGQKKVFSLVAEPVMELNVSHWLPKELENTWHGKDLPPVTKTVVRCIARQQGVGGYDSWGAHCNEKYKNKTDKTYRLKFQIRF